MMALQKAILLCINNTEKHKLFFLNFYLFRRVKFRLELFKYISPFYIIQKKLSRLMKKSYSFAL